jgi:hypothetical protein
MKGTSTENEKQVVHDDHCKFCGSVIQWAKCDGRWRPMKEDLTGFHHCLPGSVPRFRFTKEEG